MAATQNHMIHPMPNLPRLKSSVTEGGLKAKTGLTIKVFLWNQHIINPTSHHDETPLHQQKGNNLLKLIDRLYTYL